MVVLVLSFILIAIIGAVICIYGDLFLAERRGELFIIHPPRDVCLKIRNRLTADISAEEFIITAIEHELRR